VNEPRRYGSGHDAGPGIILGMVTCGLLYLLRRRSALTVPELAPLSVNDTNCCHLQRGELSPIGRKGEISLDGSERRRQTNLEANLKNVIGSAPSN
jgi:hypothetical protein